MYNIGTAFSKKPYPRGHYIYNFGRRFLIIITINSVCLILKNNNKAIMYFTVLLAWPRLSPRTTAPVVIPLYSVCLIYVWE